MDRSRATSLVAGLTSIALGLAAGRASAQGEAGAPPVTGEAGPGLARIDRAVIEGMEELKIPGASLSVAKGGALVLARGYGWADVAAREPSRPETLFALASVSKSLTAATILKLVEAKRLDLDARAFDLLDDLKPLPGDTPDPRLRDITIRHLLLHAGGWDRKISGDANGFSERVAKTMNIPLPVSPRQLSRYMMGLPLDFDPGTQSRYSNFGYILLGLVIERVAGRPYEEAVREITLRPTGLRRARLDIEPGRGYVPGEAHRYGPKGFEDRRGGHLPITMASGGWLASSTEMVRFLTALDGSRGTPFLSDPIYRVMTAAPAPPIAPRPDGGHVGMGWDVVRGSGRGVSFAKGGALLGVHSWIEHTPDGSDWALLWNGGRVAGEAEGEPAPRAFVAKVRAAITGVETWPKVDLFGREP